MRSMCLRGLKRVNPLFTYPLLPEPAQGGIISWILLALVRRTFLQPIATHLSGFQERQFFSRHRTNRWKRASPLGVYAELCLASVLLLLVVCWGCPGLVVSPLVAFQSEARPGLRHRLAHQAHACAPKRPGQPSRTAHGSPGSLRTQLQPEETRILLRELQYMIVSIFNHVYRYILYACMYVRCTYVRM